MGRSGHGRPPLRPLAGTPVLGLENSPSLRSEHAVYQSWLRRGEANPETAKSLRRPFKGHLSTTHQQSVSTSQAVNIIPIIPYLRFGDQLVTDNSYINRVFSLYITSKNI